MKESLKRHHKRIGHALAAGDYQFSDGGIVLKRDGLLLAQEYIHGVNGKDFRVDPNLLPDAGILDILNVYFGGVAKRPAFYLGIYAGAITPAANWTAANISGLSTEITSNSEGYSQATRPQWNPPGGGASAGVIDNVASLAAYTIVCSTTLNINGAFMCSDNVKGGTSGVVPSASRFSATRVVNNGDNFTLGYRVGLTS